MDQPRRDEAACRRCRQQADRCRCAKPQRDRAQPGAPRDRMITGRRDRDKNQREQR